MTRAFVFPGQGSQAIGMGKALADASATARAVFAEVDDALGQDLSGLMFGGDAATLTLTENAQPALMAVSVATCRAVVAAAGRPLPELAAFVAGHSLGEYSALAAAGALNLSDAARLLRQRGRAMQQAVPVGVGAMAALLGLDLPAVEEIAAEAAGADQVCAAANDNAAGQVVVSGHRQAVERAVAIAAGRGARRSVMLPVSAPFHCALMAPAQAAMEAALAAVAIARPAVPLIANVTARPVEDPDEIRRLLVRQVTAPVRWRESMLEARRHGVTEILELGAGKVLSGLARRIDPALQARAAGTPEEVAAVVATLDAEGGAP